MKAKPTPKNPKARAAGRTEGSQQRVVGQRIVITLTDDRPGHVELEMSFNPAIDDRTKMTPAAEVAIEMVKVFLEKSKLANCNFTKGQFV